MKASTTLLALFTTTIVACSPFSPDLGVAPYKCGTEEPRCPSGYTCEEGDPADPTTHVCVANGETAVDGNQGGFDCLDDTFGQNDTKEGAFVTPVSTQPMFAALTSLCPAADQDHYQINLTSQSVLRVATTWESGMSVSVALLNAGGTSIGNGVPKGDNENCTCARDLPTGTYYAKVFAGATVQNNYRVEIKVVTSAECTAPPACN